MGGVQAKTKSSEAREEVVFAQTPKARVEKMRGV